MQKDIAPSKLDPTWESQHNARVSLIKYSLTFSGAAAALLVSLSGKNSVTPIANSPKMALLFWGITILSGFLQYFFSYRETYYHPFSRDSFYKRALQQGERIALYTVMAMHGLAMLIALWLTFNYLWCTLP